MIRPPAVQPGSSGLNQPKSGLPLSRKANSIGLSLRDRPEIMKIQFTRLPSIATALILSLCGGLLFKLLGMPLPWMLGPMFTVGAAGISGVKVGEIRGGRQAGQLIIGCALGLYFTADVTRHILNYGGYILAAAFSAIMIGGLGGLLLKRISGIGAATAFFASVPGGASEMAVMAERAGARFDQVALSHSLRVLMVVSIIPISVTLTGTSGNDFYSPSTTLITFEGLIALISMAIATGYVFKKAGIPNAWLLGPLTVSLLITIRGQNMSAIPPLLAIAAQLLIGCSLGSRFKPSLRSESRRLVIGVLASAVFTVCLSVLMGFFLAWLTGEAGPTMVLATAPGGLSEMCITAKILKLGVPLVTAFQVTRLAIVVTCSLPAWRLLQAIRLRHNRS
jgi:membrane AbrB-like protein